MLHIRDLTTALIGPVSLALEAGEITSLMGESGAGKSLLLRAIADLDPNRGELALDGAARDAMSAPDWRRQVALVPAQSGWWAPRVGEHFAPAPDPRPLLASLGLPEALAWQVDRISTGEKQRLALARALQGAPKVLLLDEPTSGLDAQATITVESLIRNTAAKGVAVLIVTHDPAQAARLADRRFVIRAGRLEAAP